MSVIKIEQLKRKVCLKIDESAGQITGIAKKISENPELGYKEVKTSELVKNTFDTLGIPWEGNLAVTGVKGNMRGRKEGVTVAVIGEMDAVICRAHPDADNTDGKVHACGHHMQIAAMLGAAIGLKEVAEELDGNVCFFAVPAEEFIEMEYRRALAEEKKIQFYGGKQELIRIGAFDDIDMAMMVHAHGSTPQRAVFLDGGSLGFTAKTIGFHGKAAHAGGSPHEGINALNAAQLALAGINAQRETFRDEDKVRVHPIITKGGDLVNVVPEYAEIETYVRGKSFEAIKDANEKVNRAVKGAAYMVGAREEINDIKGYLPLLQNREMSRLFEENAKEFIEAEQIYHGVDMVGSSDIGDLSHLMPVIQPTMGGYNGNAHAENFCVADEISACILPAKIMAMTVIDLLAEDAKNGREILKAFKPVFTKNEYILS